MVVGLLTLDIYIPGADSLKAKRYILRSIKDRLKRYNVSVAEDGNNLWQRTTLAVACVSHESSQLYSTFESIKKQIINNGDIEIIQMRMEIL